MGSGKTTIGTQLARQLAWRFVDLDDLIESAAGIRIADFFERHGEPSFRLLEATQLRGALGRAFEHREPSVLALGGGAFVQPGNFELVENHGVTLWLDCPLETVQRRVADATHRPLARDPERFEQLYQDRRAGYGRADYRIQIESDDPAITLATVLALPVFHK